MNATQNMTDREAARQIMRKACQDDDPALLDEAISMITADESRFFYYETHRAALENNALAILTHLLSRGQSILPISPSDAARSSDATLEFLLAHGWDINTRGTPNPAYQPPPYLWSVLGDIDRVRWCLAHGASVHPEGVEPLRSDVVTMAQRGCEQLLECAAWSASVETFELLRSKGAPLGWRPLHLAVRCATLYQADRPGEARTEQGRQHEARMAMVRHLVDVVGIDVNAADQPVGSRVPDRIGSPLCYVAAAYGQEPSVRELVWCLLDRGADPVPALEEARLSRHATFADDVEAWRARQRGAGRGGCCLQ